MIHNVEVLSIKSEDVGSNPSGAREDFFHKLSYGVN